MKKYKKNEMNRVQNIGIIMFGLMGDVLIRTPVIKALKEIYKNSHIIAIVDPIGVALLENNKDVNHLIVVDRSANKLIKKFHELITIVEMRKYKFDLLVNLYNGGSSPWMTLFSGARYRLGFCQQKKKYIYNVINECSEDRLRSEQSLYSYMISIIEPLSSRRHSLKPVFINKDETLASMKEYLKQFTQYKNRIYLLNLGASKEDKLLDMKKYTILIEYIYKK